MRLSTHSIQTVGSSICLLTLLLLVLATSSRPLFAQEEPPSNPVQVAHTAVETIVGGKPAARDEWGWQVLVRPGGRLCGGALIAEEWVVTAAHCVYQSQGDFFAPEQITVVVGEYDRSVSEASEQALAVVDLFAHAHFDKWSNNNDIALLHLATPVTMTGHISPVVPLTEELIALTEAGRLATVTGWGTTSEGGAASQVLMEVTVPVVDSSICNRSYGIITDNMLCAGYAEGGKDACQGDSGGPLVVQDDNEQWHLAGIVSFGYGCARANYYGVYTRISQYNTWMNAIIDANTKKSHTTDTDDADDTGTDDTNNDDTDNDDADDDDDSSSDDTGNDDTDNDDTDNNDTDNNDSDNTGTDDTDTDDVSPDIADGPADVDTSPVEAHQLYLPMVVR